MIIGALSLQLSIPAHSLKDKRQVLRSLQARLRNEFNVSVAEIAEQDRHTVGVVGVVCVSSDRDYAHGLLMKVIDFVERTRLDCDLIDYDLELM